MPTTTPSFCTALLLSLLAAGRLSAAASGADFLLLEPAARSSAVGGAFGAASAQTECLRYNPAGISGYKGLGASVAHVAAAGDWSHEWAALAVNAGPLAVGVEVLLSSMAPFELYDRNGNNAGTAQVGSQNGMVALALPLGAWLDMGVGFRLFRSQLHTFTSQGMALDLGLQARSEAWPVVAGLSLQNVGSQSAYFMEADPLPVCVRAGLEGRLPLDKDFMVRPRADLVYFEDKTRPLEMRGGVEAEFYRQAFLRVGFLRASSFQQLSLGAGFRWQNISVDYAFQPGNELGNSQLIELQLASY